MQKETFRLRQVIGENIREGRRRLGFTQEQFAEIIELSVQSLSGLENGIKFARMDTYCRIAEMLVLPIHALFQAHQSQDEVLVEQLRLLLYDFEKEEQKALLNIMREIESLIRKKR